MSGVRYRQFCPIARAAEVLGERWTLLVLRELLVGPQRFSDLRRRLPGVSSSVLADRLGRLEERGVVRRRSLAPPAASTVYELDEHGRALLPAVRELFRWGMRFLLPPRPGERLEASWVPLALELTARRGTVPRCSAELRIRRSGAEALRVRVAGTPRGTVVGEAGPPADVAVSGSAMDLLAVGAGLVDPRDALRRGALEVQAGDAGVLRSLPALFDLSFPAEVRATSPADAEP
jgi:DNA-binding HxlR family transcriptional regulator